MLEIVEFHLKREGFRCCTIKGSVPAKQRSDMVETFNSDPLGPEVCQQIFKNKIQLLILYLYSAIEQAAVFPL